MVEGKDFIVTMTESSVGKTVASPLCALAGTHSESTKSVIHNFSDLTCILHFFSTELLPLSGLLKEFLLFIEQASITHNL